MIVFVLNQSAIHPSYVDLKRQAVCLEEMILRAIHLEVNKKRNTFVVYFHL